MVLSSVPRQSGGYFLYAQRHVRTVFYCGQMPVVLLTGAVLGQGCCLPVVFTPVRTVQTVQKTRILQRSSGGLSTCPLVCILQGFGQTVEKTGVPQLQFFAGH